MELLDSTATRAENASLAVNPYRCATLGAGEGPGREGRSNGRRRTRLSWARRYGQEAIFLISKLQVSCKGFPTKSSSIDLDLEENSGVGVLP